jgi:uncharacterized membrane protein YhaH (DUF805 family)
MEQKVCGGITAGSLSRSLKQPPRVSRILNVITSTAESLVEQIPKYRNMLLQVVLFVITFGIYGLYWFYSTASEMKEMAHDEDASPGMWTVLMVIPIVNLYSMYCYGELFEKTSGGKLPGWALLLLWVICAPAVWVIVQLDLNQKSDAALRERVYGTA